MDIRDIKDTVPDTFKGDGLEQMFKLQIELLDKYRKVEVGGLPAYPINIHERESQILLKDFIARVIEELGEAHESYIEMVQLYDDNKADDDMMLNHLQNFNEELSDALHFMLELFVYCNINAEDIHAYYDELLKARDWKDAFFFPKNALKTVMVYARQCTIEMQTLPASFQGFKVLDDEKVLKNEFLRGGRKVSIHFLQEHKIQLWDITYHLNKARNFLKVIDNKLNMVPFSYPLSYLHLYLHPILI